MNYVIAGVKQTPVHKITYGKKIKSIFWSIWSDLELSYWGIYCSWEKNQWEFLQNILCEGDDAHLRVWLVIVYFFYPSNFVICLPVNFPPHVGHLVLPFHRKICTIYFYIVPNNHVSYFSWYILKMVDFMFREKNNKDVDGLIHSQNQTSRLYPD